MLTLPRPKPGDRVLVPFEEIASEVCELYAIAWHDLVAPRSQLSRREPIIMAALLLREFTSMSLREIGEHLGGRDHSTIAHHLAFARSFDEQATERRNYLSRRLKSRAIGL